MPNQAIRYIPHGRNRGMAPFVPSSAHVTVWHRDAIVAQYQQIHLAPAAATRPHRWRK